MNNDDALYNDLYHKAVDMQYKFHDFTEGVNDPHVHVLQNEIHQLIGDIRERKDPQTLEGRIRTIQQQLSEGQHIPHPYINYGHSDYLHSNYEHMRQNLRQFETGQHY